MYVRWSSANHTLFIEKGKGYVFTILWYLILCLETVLKRYVILKGILLRPLRSNNWDN